MRVEQLRSKQGGFIEGPLILTPQAFRDKRGWFIESWNQRCFDEAVGESVVFSQDNHSLSIHGVLRGMHYQLPPSPQAKLVRVSKGAIFDVVVDIRLNSVNFGQWVSVELSAENRSQLWIPEGFAHGFLSLTEIAEVQYKTRGFWEQDCERAILWNDPDLDITWPVDQLMGTEVSLSKKDSEAPGFNDCLKAGDVFP